MSSVMSAAKAKAFATKDFVPPRLPGFLVMFAKRTLLEERMEREPQCGRHRRSDVHVGVHQALLPVVDTSHRERGDRHSQHDVQPQFVFEWAQVGKHMLLLRSPHDELRGFLPERHGVFDHQATSVGHRELPKTKIHFLQQKYSI